MESSEVLKTAIQEKGVKQVASALKVSTSLVYKWCQDKESESGSGVENPLDRVGRIVEFTGDTAPIHWLCQSAGGFFVENPVRVEQTTTPVIEATQHLLSEFSELLAAVSQSYNSDMVIDQEEAGRIRKEWEELKTLAEQFVVACESGIYDQGS